ncbi:protein GOLVEN 3-like [Raphanus sativus]|uniref:Protein GOLVEN 3-like n=1 Tax=Raphanus sativus TaxID=3726 RepID=A0A6J0N5L4_RAPSA|nr:protein GOLVEN 3-like [Raphanus sativus]
MARFTITILSFLIIIQALEEDRILVYAYEGGDAGHKSLDYLGDKDTSILHPKESYDFTNIAAPRKLRFGRTMRATVARTKKEQVKVTNNDEWILKISEEHKTTNILAELDTTKVCCESTI